MAYTKEPRKVTKHQFATSTTVDGSRIDACMDDVTDRFNNIQKGDVGTAWVQNVFHCGWQPKARFFPYSGANPENMYDFKHHYPWLSVKNDASTPEGQLTLDSSNNLTTAPASVQNTYRLKGYDNTHGGATTTSLYDLALQDPYIGGAGDAYNRLKWRRAFSWPIYFQNPVVISQVSLIIRADGSDSSLGTNRPYQYEPDWTNLEVPKGSVIIDVADPASTEDKSLDTQEYIRSDYPFDYLPFNYHTTNVFTPTYNDMLPSVKAAGSVNVCGHMDGIASIDEINMPLASDSRVRVSVVIPGSLEFDSLTGVESSHMSFWNPMSLTVHVLERIS